MKPSVFAEFCRLSTVGDDLIIFASVLSLCGISCPENDRYQQDKTGVGADNSAVGQGKRISIPGMISAGNIIELIKDMMSHPLPLSQ